MAITLDVYLKNLDNLTKGTAIEFPMQLLFAHVLRSISQVQIPDTTYARALIVKGIALKLGLDVNDVKRKSYNWWENHGYPDNAKRRWHNANEGSAVSSGGTYTLDLKTHSIEWRSDDPGIINQNNGQPASKSVKGRTGGYPTGHVDIVANRYNSGKYYAVWKMIDKEISRYVNYFLMTGKPLKAGVR